MKEIIINEKDSGQRLDKYLKKYMPSAGTGFLYKMLRKKNIVLNGKKAEGNELLKAGDGIRIFFSDGTLEKMRHKTEEPAGNGGAYPEKTGKGKGSKGSPDEGDIRINVIYENEDILIMDKPAGLLSQGDESGEISANDLLRRYCLDKGAAPDETYRPSVCNRLDRNTSGLLLCAKSYAGSRFLNHMIKSHLLKKIYLATAEGLIEKGGRLDGYLEKDGASNKVFIRNSGKESGHIITVYRPLKHDGRYTEIEVELITGKSHQIRAHMASIGHPLAGDVKYGGHPFKGKRVQQLCAYKIIFPKAVDDTKDDNIQRLLKELLKDKPDGTFTSNTGGL
ncbi:MAG: RluA family pseudouridine synthase [Lachnospiraceae bacterium]|nr:RluA family pseudouridine synthase [Lachnospiraceae bacterium]